MGRGLFVQARLFGKFLSCLVPRATVFRVWKRPAPFSVTVSVPENGTCDGLVHLVARINQKDRYYITILVLSHPKLRLPGAISI
jgi:hypothetical protein